MVQRSQFFTWILRALFFGICRMEIEGKTFHSPGDALLMGVRLHGAFHVDANRRRAGR